MFTNIYILKFYILENKISIFMHTLLYILFIFNLKCNFSVKDLSESSSTIRNFQTAIVALISLAAYLHFITHV